MTLKQYLSIMLLATVLCWSAWLFVVVNTSPLSGELITHLFFHLTLFFSLLGTISLLSFSALRYFSHGITPMFHHVHRSFRIAVISALAVVSLLVMQGKEMLHMWNVIILLGIVLFIFLFKISTLAYRS